MPLDFSGVGDVKASLNANYARAGHYLVLIRKTGEINTRSSGDGLLIEQTCVHVFPDSENLRGHPPELEDEPLTTLHYPGEEFAHLILQREDMFLPNVKAFIAAITGDDPSDKSIPNEQWVAAANATISDEQPFAGLLLEVNNVNIATKLKNPFTRIGYLRVVTPEQVLKEVAGTEHENAVFTDEQWAELVSS